MSEWQHISYAVLFVIDTRAVRELRNLLKALGVRQVMLVTSPGRDDSEEGETLRRAVGPFLSSNVPGTETHVPATRARQAGIQARRDGVDAVVSFGGRSCCYLSKALCFFFEQDAGTPGASFQDHPARPHVTVPTTYSGAEITPSFAVTDPHTRQKSGTSGPTLTPRAAVYDAALSLSTPPRLTAETGMNALAHCVEAMWSRSASGEAIALAVAGLTAIRKALPLAVEEPEELDYRIALQEGAYLAARSLQNASMGVHHGLSQLVAARAGISHGLVHAVLLPHAIHYNADEVPEVVRSVGEAFGWPDDPVRAVSDFAQGLGLPGSLSDCGVTRADLEAVARLSQSSRDVRANRKPVSEADALAILEDAL